jgi:serine/threonine protein kinase
MEYISHGDLQQYLDRPFPDIEARQITRQIVEAVHYMHTNGFSHRDLKPGVIYLRFPGQTAQVR